MTYSGVAHQYARNVVSGIIPACMEVRQAAKRHLDHLAQRRKAEFPFKYDDAKAEYVCRFIENLPHTKGEWARPRPGFSTLLKLEPWQVWITCSIFGWMEKATGLRKYSEAYLEIPRKNAKSTWAAAIGNYMNVADGEFGAEVYCGATTERQAMEVFKTARLQVVRSPEMQKHFGVECSIKSIFREEDGSKFAPVVGNPGDGASPSCAILDEEHEHVTPVLIDTMRTGMGARSQPLLIHITTAGVNLAGPCYVNRSEARRVLGKLIENEALFAAIYTIDEGDDWKSEASLRKANPNWGVSVKPDFLLKELRRAILSPYLQQIFKTKHENIWGGASNNWMNMEAWHQCYDPTMKREDFVGQPCWEGVDLAARIDLASRMQIYKRKIEGLTHYFLFGRHYVPRQTAMDGEHAHYAMWVTQGYLQAHEGAEIQLGRIQVEMERDVITHDFQCIAFDQYSAQQMQQELEMKTPRDVIITIPQTTKYLSDGMLEVEASVISGRIHHDGDPVLAWAMSNVISKLDPNDNPFPRKERPENKIDPVSALLNAMSRAYVAPAARPSVYETRGLRTL